MHPQKAKQALLSKNRKRLSAKTFQDFQTDPLPYFAVRLTRLTNALSRRIENLEAAL